MLTPARLAAALGLLTLIFAAHPATSRANCPSLGENQTCIDQPQVNAHTTDRTDKTFPAGSHVSIEANGCEQTGGSGDTWKRYVNPDPQNASSNSYHGLAGIYPSNSGAATTLGLSRIQNIQGNVYRVTTPSFLRVGFEDSDYSDNGYNDHDNGDDDQCAGGSWGYGGPAYILLTVTPNAAPSVSATQPAAYVSGQTTFTVASHNDPDGDPLTYRYLIDGADVSGAAGTSYKWSVTGDRTHQLVIRATDSYGAHTDSAPRSFSVDNTSPTVAITSGPSNQTFGPGSTQTWRFSASDGSGSGVQGVQCRLDGALVTCSSASSHSVSNLPNGTHTFSVQATDRLGHVSSVDSRSFAIDATPPETTVTAGPAEGASTTDTTIAYTLGSSEGGSSFSCRSYADQPAPIKPAFAPCSGGSAHLMPNLTPGKYVFEAYATDAYGNADPTPVVRHFTVAAPAPQGGTPGGGTSGGGGGGGTSGGGTSGGGTSGGVTSGGGTPTVPVTTTAAPGRRPAIHATLVYAYKSPTRLTKLTLKHVPKGSTVRVTCHGKCPKALRKRYTKRHVSGSLSLTRLVRRRLKPGVSLKIVVSHKGWRSVTKTVRIRRGRPPLIR